MSNELTTMTTETLLAMGIAHYDQCENAQQQAVINAAKSGMYFLEAKAKMKHGEFMPKIAQLRADISHSKINKYMQLSKEMPELLNSETFPNLKIGQAIALMSAPEELKTEIVERIDNGEEISSREIQRLKKEAADLLASKNALQSDLMQKVEQLDQKQKRINFLELDKEATVKQNDELRNQLAFKVDEQVQAKLADERAKLILENQQAIAEEKRKAENAQADLERLKKEQAKAIKDGVSHELAQLERELDLKQSQIESCTKRIQSLRETELSLEREVGHLQTHKKAIEKIKDNLSFLTVSFSDAFDTNVIPAEVAGEWDAIYFALSKLKTQMSEWRDRLNPIESEAIVGELVEIETPWDDESEEAFA